LQILLEQPGKIIPREDLQRRIWPTDTFVDFDHGINNAVKKLRESLGDAAETPLYIETSPRYGYRFIGKIEREAPRMRSLAVLPLEDLAHDPQQDYFAEGLTEALITTLAKIGELRVVSRTSAMLYKGVHKPLREIAKELGVDAVVEGTVLREGNRVRITAQLIDTFTETHLWADSYERDLRNMLGLQSELTQAIARNIRVKLTPQERALFEQECPVDAEAYEAYLKGRYYWNRRSGEGLGKSVQYFQQAIARDSTYAAAYSGLADGLTISATWSLLPPEEGCGKAKKIALQALEIDSSLAEAHSSFAWATMWYDYDFLTAEREFERSIELNPRYATAREWFGMLLGLIGRYEEGYTELKRAIRLDPCSSVMHWALAFVYWCGRRNDAALEQIQRALELDPHFTPAYWQLGVVNLNQGAYLHAVPALQKADDVSPGIPQMTA
jgi:TolB-like protein